MLLEQVNEALHQHPGFAGAGACVYQERASLGLDSGLLFGSGFHGARLRRALAMP
jgi:hypothetical protein